MRAMRERASEVGGREAVREPVTVSILDACVKVARHGKQEVDKFS